MDDELSEGILLEKFNRHRISFDAEAPGGFSPLSDISSTSTVVAHSSNVAASSKMNLHCCDEGSCASDSCICTVDLCFLARNSRQLSRTCNISKVESSVLKDRLNKAWNIIGNAKTRAEAETSGGMQEAGSAINGVKPVAACKKQEVQLFGRTYSWSKFRPVLSKELLKELAPSSAAATEPETSCENHAASALSQLACLKSAVVHRKTKCITDEDLLPSQGTRGEPSLLPRCPTSRLYPFVL
jgi:hypothetical protein